MIVDNGYRIETGKPESIFSRLFNDKYFITLEAISNNLGCIRVTCDGLEVSHKIEDGEIKSRIIARYLPESGSKDGLNASYISELSNFLSGIKDMLKDLNKDELSSYEFLNKLV